MWQRMELDPAWVNNHTRRNNSKEKTLKKIFTTYVTYRYEASQHHTRTVKESASLPSFSYPQRLAQLV